MAQRGYNSNLASEFHVLSTLYRLGVDASLTLGNRKAVDIVVAYSRGDSATVEVKAIAGKDDWLVGNVPVQPKQRHFVVLVSYDNKIADPSFPPRCWIFRHEEVIPLIRTLGAVRYIRRRDVLDTAHTFEGRWSVLKESD